jgi:hypothetical protein
MRFTVCGEKRKGGALHACVSIKGMVRGMHQRLTSFNPDFFAGEHIRNKKLNFNVIVFAGLKSDKKVS